MQKTNEGLELLKTDEGCRMGLSLVGISFLSLSLLFFLSPLSRERERESVCVLTSMGEMRDEQVAAADPRKLSVRLRG